MKGFFFGLFLDFRLFLELLDVFRYYDLNLGKQMKGRLKGKLKGEMKER